MRIQASYYKQFEINNAEFLNSIQNIKITKLNEDEYESEDENDNSKTKKCPRCHKDKPEAEYIKKDKTLKLCQRCRELGLLCYVNKIKKFDSLSLYIYDTGDHKLKKLCKYCIKYKSITEYLNLNDEDKFLCCDQCREYKYSKSRIDKLGCSKNQVMIFYINSKKNKCCIDCGENNFEVLEFDHRDPSQKVKEVPLFTNIEDMKKEIDKCDLRCVRCHAIKTHENNYLKRTGMNYNKQYRDRNREYMEKIKIKIGGCEICKWFDINNLSALQFDHLDRENKITEVSKLIGNPTSLKKLQDEIDKCRLLCANCHKLHTVEQRGYYKYKNVNY
jgi:hypothetical protein